MSLKKPIRKKRKIMGASPSSSFSIQNDFTPSMDSPVYTAPLEILEEIFHNLPWEEVVRHCRLVSKQWKEVADSESLWRERCRREGYLPRNASMVPNDWREFYFLCKKRRNLLKNTRAAEKFKYWQLVSNGGDRWKIEESMCPHPNEAVLQNFVTSYGLCLKSQLIDLKSEGYYPAFMDLYQPAIKISDWYAARWDCACEYTIKVELLNQKKKSIQTFEPETVHIEQWSDQQWHQMTHVFKNYGPGVRYINFVHGGKDSQFWAGWYGVRLADSSVEICPDVE
uniref:Si:dkey-147f3.4 n=1 Tax=Neogobius melanostomus TaxID=47308 RepID=A0A8C6V0I5_9GOBI